MQKIKAFFDPRTYTLTYVVHDEQTGDAVVIDPVLDYDPLASQTSTESADAVSEYLREQGLRLRYILETHAHADHLSASHLLRQRFETPVAIGAGITAVQETFKDIFDLTADFPTNGSQFDRLIQDNDVLQAGSLGVTALATPGHTPACMSYLLGDVIFTGDALFMEDYGTGRCDFPRGSAEDLYRSIKERLYTLPDSVRVFVGHDYQPGGRPLRWETTIGIEKRHNIQIRADTLREHFVTFRKERDATLAPPRLLFPSVQVNIDAGRLPAARPSGKRYLRLPLNLFHPTDDLGVPKDRAG